MTSSRRSIIAFILFLVCGVGGAAAAAPSVATSPTTEPAIAPATQRSYTRRQDIVYGRIYGTALTLDVFTPTTHRNGAGVILIASGGWISSHDAIGGGTINLFIRPFLDRGYTVFAVVHASQPKFTIAEIRQNIDRAVRFIRARAASFGIDPDRIALTGGSAGGHLSLLQATDPSRGHPLSFDPIERASGRVQAVGVFFPPTDFLNWGQPGHLVTRGQGIRPFMAAFDFQKMSPETGEFERVSDEEAVQILREVSPIYHVSAQTPPTLILHGDADALVPLQQSKSFIKRLEDAHVESQLVIKPGAGHGWFNIRPDVEQIADWFDAHLSPRGATTRPAARAE